MNQKYYVMHAGSLDSNNENTAWAQLLSQITDDDHDGIRNIQQLFTKNI